MSYSPLSSIGGLFHAFGRFAARIALEAIGGGKKKPVHPYASTSGESYNDNNNNNNNNNNDDDNDDRENNSEESHGHETSTNDDNDEVHYEERGDQHERSRNISPPRWVSGWGKILDNVAERITEMQIDER